MANNNYWKYSLTEAYINSINILPIFPIDAYDYD